MSQEYRSCSHQRNSVRYRVFGESERRRRLIDLAVTSAYADYLTFSLIIVRPMENHSRVLWEIFAAGRDFAQYRPINAIHDPIFRSLSNCSILSSLASSSLLRYRAISLSPTSRAYVRQLGRTINSTSRSFRAFVPY